MLSIESKFNKIIKYIFIVLLYILFNYWFHELVDSSILKLYFGINFQSILFLIILNICFALLVLPCSIFGYLFGLIYGEYLGFLFVCFASTTSATITFFIARKYNFEKFIFFNSKKVLRLIDLIEVYSFKASFFTFLNPLIPTASVGYLFGTSKIKFQDYIIGCILGTAPVTLLVIYLGNNGKWINEIIKSYLF